MKPRTLKAWGLAVSLAITIAPAAAAATTATGTPPDVTGVGFTSTLGTSIDESARFNDERGQPVSLRSVLQGRPSILLLGYFRCPNLCSTVRADTARALAASGLSSADDYSVAAVSIDPHESAVDAAYARQQDVAMLDAGAAAVADTLHWHYLTGDADSIAALSLSVGFASRYDAASAQYVHPPGLVVLAPNGVVSGYLLGVGYRPQALREALAQATRGAVAKAFAPLALLCFSYDAHTGRYSLAIMKVLRLAAITTVLATLGVLLLAHRARKSPP